MNSNGITAIMEVTRENFEEVLLSLPEVFQNAQFITFDTEFTGLNVEGASNLNYFDSLEDLYLKDRLRAETFMAIQIGLVAFFYNEETDQYTHAGYNFYVYPSPNTNINFTCQSKSIEFLVQHGFDFNKLFKEGIPYMKESEMEKHLERLTEKNEKKQSLSNSSQMQIPMEHKETISKIISRIKEILNSNSKTSFQTERHNRFIRRLIYGSVQQEFGSTVLLESNKDDSMTISVGFNETERKEKQDEKFLVKKNELLKEVGFSKVIKLLVESKKLLVGHNLFLDILFIIRQFLVPLPDNYSEFKELVKFLFPNIIDTKYMAGSEVRNIKDTSLDNVLGHFKNLNALPQVLVDKCGTGYDVEQEKFHEAAYDAYLTGICFLAMVKNLGNLNFTSSTLKNLEKSPILQSVLNKLSIPKLCDLFCINIGGLDNKPDRTGVYHLSFPEEWTRDNIMELFKNYGVTHISWINSTSAFVKVKKEFIREVEKNLMGQNKNYKLLTYSKFKCLNCKPDETKVSSPIVEKRVGNDEKSCLSNNSPSNVTVNEPIRKRKFEEDIGEIIERPQKKKNMVD